MLNRDVIGGRGEALFYRMITEFRGLSEPLFQPFFLGERYPTVDFLVHVTGTTGMLPFFFVQVKTTTQKRISHGSALSINLNAWSIRQLKNLPAPTYLVGIDEFSETGYLLSVDENLPSTLTRFPMRHPLEGMTLQSLREEVNYYWHQRDMMLRSSHFSYNSEVTEP